jgi:hypothetical protein
MIIKVPKFPQTRLTYRRIKVHWHSNFVIGDGVPPLTAFLPFARPEWLMTPDMDFCLGSCHQPPQFRWYNYPHRFEYGVSQF